MEVLLNGEQCVPDLILDQIILQTFEVPLNWEVEQGVCQISLTGGSLGSDVELLGLSGSTTSYVGVADGDHQSTKVVVRLEDLSLEEDVNNSLHQFVKDVDCSFSGCGAISFVLSALETVSEADWHLGPGSPSVEDAVFESENLRSLKRVRKVIGNLPKVGQKWISFFN